MTSSALSFVLHGHLPFIRHPEHKFHLEERWFYEAMHESYLPLLQMLYNLERDQIPGKITLSLSATLIAMMANPLLIERFSHILDELIRLSQREEERLKNQPEFHELTHFYLHRFHSQKELFNSIDRNILKAFADLHRRNRLELITCVGTHGILPLMATDEAMAAQVKSSVEDFKQRLGFQPAGIWLAECGYTPGVEQHLYNNNISYSFVEGDAILNADSAPVAATYAPLISAGNVAFFGRSKTASAEVWSSKEGYPGDFNYREFYRDLGYDLPHDLIKDWIHPDGIRVNTGIKYHRITGHVDLGEKDLYSPTAAYNTAKGHAKDFVYKRLQEAKSVAPTLQHLDTVHFTCPYDAELFGHWWFEGPIFLEEVLREAAYHDSLTLESPCDYLKNNPIQQQANPAPSTWGEKGTFEFWVDPCNVWIYPLLHDAELRFRDLVNTIDKPDSLVTRALNQAGRELMLAQASDWAFIMKTGTTVEYAELRTRQHLKHFHLLADQIESLDVNQEQLHELERDTPIFPHLHWQFWKTP